MICHQNEIENEEEKMEKEREVVLKDINDIANIENEQRKREFKNKNDKIKRLKRYDKIFDNQMSMFG